MKPKDYHSERTGGGYMKMMKYVMFSTVLSTSEKLVYTYIANEQDYAEYFGRLNEDESVTVSVSKCARDLNIARQTAQTALKHLCDLQLLERVPTRQGEKSCYRLPKSGWKRMLQIDQIESGNDPIPLSPSDFIAPDKEAINQTINQANQFVASIKSK